MLAATGPPPRVPPRSGVAYDLRCSIRQPRLALGEWHHCPRRVQRPTPPSTLVARIEAQIHAAKRRETEVLAAYRQSVLHAVEDVEIAFSGLVKREQEAGFPAVGVDPLTQARAASVGAGHEGVVSLVEDCRPMKTCSAHPTYRPRP